MRHASIGVALTCAALLAGTVAPSPSPTSSGPAPIPASTSGPAPTMTEAPLLEGGGHRSATVEAAEACLARPVVVEAVSGAENYPGAEPLPDGAAIDARTTEWTYDTGYPVLVRGHRDSSDDRNDLCLVGGRISSPLPHDTTDWDTWHGTAAVSVRRANFQLIGTQIHNAGDAIRFSKAQASDWRVQGVRVSQVHDDCVENDAMNSGTIDDSFFDGCYVFYSARGSPRRGLGGPLDGADEKVTITNSLVRLEPMPSLYDDSPGPGHGPFFKLSSVPATGRSPALAIHDTVFRADQAPHHGNLGIPALDDDRRDDVPGTPYLDPDDCSGNTMVWLGEGPYPADLPPCFEITTDPRVWEWAVLDWETPPDVARAAADRVARLLYRATCGRIGTDGD